jgi:hypothetical protein
MMHWHRGAKPMAKDRKRILQLTLCSITTMAHAVAIRYAKMVHDTISGMAFKSAKRPNMLIAQFGYLILSTKAVQTTDDYQL